MEVVRVFGSPGSGKTTKLLEIYGEELSRGIAPEDIAFVTFTRKGVAEGKSRVIKKYALSHDQVKNFRTLHSMAFYLGGHSREEILDKDSLERINYILGTNITGENYKKRDRQQTDDVYVEAHGVSRNNPDTRHSAIRKPSFDLKKAKKIEQYYSLAKQSVGKLDFTDLLEELANGDNKARVKVAFIDEAQDLTPLQWAGVRKIFSDVERLYIAGDDDQALYHWNGASVAEFLETPATDIVLEKSYRLPRNIWTIANRIAEGISYRKDKIYQPVAEGGEVWLVDELKDLPLNQKEDWLILARDNNKLVDVRKHLNECLLPYSEEGRTWTGKNNANLITLYESIRKGESSETEESKAKLSKVYKGTDFKDPWHKAFDWPNYKKDFFLRYFLRHGTYTPTESGVEIGTFHSSKGGEADNVVVILDHTKIVAEEKLINPDNEMRCLYVASTRAKRRLFYVDLGGKNSYLEDLERLKIQIEEYKK